MVVNLSICVPTYLTHLCVGNAKINALQLNSYLNLKEKCLEKYIRDQTFSSF